MVRFGIETGRPEQRVELARALAMTTYRSSEEFAARFDGPAEVIEGRFTFPVEQYLAARGRDYSAHYCAESFLCLSESIDLHRVDVARIFVPTTVVGIREDRRVPLQPLHLQGLQLLNGARRSQGGRASRGARPDAARGPAKLTRLTVS